MRKRFYWQAASGKRGAALVAISITMVGLGMLSLAIVSFTNSASNAQRQSREETSALYVAQAGVAEALYSLSQGGSGDVGSEQEWAELGGTEYWVDTTDNGDGTYDIRSTGVDGKGGGRLDVVVRQTNSSFFQWGAFGDEYLHLDAQALADSYSSSAGTYASQATNGSGSSLHAAEQGSTGSNGEVSMDQNSKVFGDSRPGPDGSISILGNAEVHGSTSPLGSAVDFPAIELPDISSSGALDLANNSSTSIGPGEIHKTSLAAHIGSTLHVYGPATVIFDSFRLYSQARIIVHAENGPVDFYVVNDFVINSNVTVASTDYRPADVRFNLLSDNIINVEDEVDMDNLDFDSNSKFYGTIYAPQALINIDSNFELFGSLMAKQLDLDSNCRIHYDEDLRNGEEGGAGTYAVVSWRELSYHPGHGHKTSYR